MHEQDTTESWADVPGYEGFYEVSDHGRVRSVTRTVKVGERKDGTTFTRRHHGRALTACTPSGGYPTVVLWKRGVDESKRVHVLVLEAFRGACPAGLACRHLDSNRQNNHLTNLEWGTYSENQMDRVDAGTSNRGERNGQAKLARREVLSIRRQHGLRTQQQLADEFNVSAGCIQRILERVTWAWLEE